MKKNLLTLIVCAFLVISVVGCGNSSNDDGGASSKPLSETISISDLNKKTDENNDTVKNYANKKIKVTGLTVDNYKHMSEANKLVSVSIVCNNVDSLDIKTGDVVSVTGVVEESTSTMSLYFLNGCTIEK